MLRISSMTWTQKLYPLGGSLAASTLVAALPLSSCSAPRFFSGGARTGRRWPGLAMVLVAATVVYHMRRRWPFAAAATACFTACCHRLDRAERHLSLRYHVQTGQFEIIRQSIAGLSADRRIQTRLSRSSFGGGYQGRGLARRGHFGLHVIGHRLQAPAERPRA